MTANDTTESETHEVQPTTETSSDDSPSLQSISRRRFVQASAAGAVLLGSSSMAAGQSGVVEETCESNGTIEVGGGDFWVVNNDWGASVEDYNFEMCSWLNDDGSYGYDWTQRPSTGSGQGQEPNYPQVLLGTKPWGSDTGVESFPIERGNVDEFVLDIDVDVNITGEEWNLAEEWWLLEEPPDPDNPTHTHEIMLVLDWNDGHSHGGVEEPGVWTDQFGNTVDHWTTYNEGGGTDAAFHIFRVSGGMTSGKVDLTEVIDFMDERYGTRDDLLLSGVEVGNEYWDHTQGEVTYNKLDVTINGTTYESGSDSDGNGGNGGEDDTIEVGDYEVEDSDDDGLYDDFDGDGQTTHDDVTAFFENINSDAVENNADAFDFAGNGEVGFSDVIDLLRRA